MEKKALLRKIPNMNELLESEEIGKYMEILGNQVQSLVKLQHFQKIGGFQENPPRRSPGITALCTKNFTACGRKRRNRLRFLHKKYTHTG